MKIKKVKSTKWKADTIETDCLRNMLYFTLAVAFYNTL